jgi:hypothetical protein
VRPGRHLALALALAAASPLAACGGSVVEQASAEAETQALLEETLAVEVDAVECPEDASAEPETEFDCTASVAGGDSITVTAEVTNEEGDVEITGVN